jgi:hypothetical protein
MEIASHPPHVVSGWIAFILATMPASEKRAGGRGHDLLPPTSALVAAGVAFLCGPLLIALLLIALRRTGWNFRWWANRFGRFIRLG